jgi:hypothetical protein
MHTFDASTETVRILYPQIPEPQFGEGALTYSVSCEGTYLVSVEIYYTIFDHTYEQNS